jgi:prepilin-type N-terminal cleavage/methylation domain-containing protein
MKKSFQRGYTLVEMTIVIMIIIILMTMITVGTRAYLDRKKLEATVTELEELEVALQTYWDMHKDFPPSAQISTELKGLIIFDGKNPFQEAYTYEYLDASRVKVSTKVPSGMFNPLSQQHFKFTPGPPKDTLEFIVVPKKSETDIQEQYNERDLYGK